MDFLENIQPIFLVSAGSIIGANMRYFIFQKLDKFFIKSELKTVIINILSSFLLGFFSAIFTNEIYSAYSYQIVLLVVIGFLGSLSTFSSFVYDLFQLSCRFQFTNLIKTCAFSLVFGIFALSIGFFFGNQ